VDLRYEGQIIVNPDKPVEREAAAPEHKAEKKPVVEAKKNDKKSRRVRH
jgi:hypothetical protein